MTLLEAVVAMAIVGLVAVATLEGFSTEIRTGSKATEARVLEALARDRLASLQIAPLELLVRLPDSLARGAFPEPFRSHTWTASVRADRNLPSLLEASVLVRSRTGEIWLTTRLFRPAAQVARVRR